MATFTWCVSPGTSLSREPRVITFDAERYEQRAVDGINADLEKWDVLLADRDDLDADAIDSFLRECEGRDSFDWTSPSGTAGKFICSEWSRERASPVHSTIRAMFEQVAGA